MSLVKNNTHLLTIPPVNISTNFSIIKVRCSILIYNSAVVSVYFYNTRSYTLRPFAAVLKSLAGKLIKNLSRAACSARSTSWFLIAENLNAMLKWSLRLCCIRMKGNPSENCRRVVEKCHVKEFARFSRNANHPLLLWRENYGKLDWITICITKAIIFYDFLFPWKLIKFFVHIILLRNILYIFNAIYLLTLTWI